jgi:hypothetical protein
MYKYKQNGDTKMKFREFINEEVFDDFDLKAIEKTLSETVSKLIKTKVSLSIIDGKNGYKKIESADLAKSMKPVMFKSLTISGDVFVSKDGYVGVNASYSYEHFDGGTNGCGIGRIFFEKDGKLKVTQTAFK